jgi:hypothetical protein
VFVSLALIIRAFSGNVNWAPLIFLIYTYNCWMVLLQSGVRAAVIIGAYSTPIAGTTFGTTFGTTNQSAQGLLDQYSASGHCVTTITLEQLFFLAFLIL